MLPCRRRRRWRPCAARALCPLKPWWAVLGLLCPSMNYTGCPGTSVSVVPLLSSRLSFPSPPNSPDSVFSIHVPGKQAAVDVYVSVVYDVPLPLQAIYSHFVADLSFPLEVCVWLLINCSVLCLTVSLFSYKKVTLPNELKLHDRVWLLNCKRNSL